MRARPVRVRQATLAAALLAAGAFALAATPPTPTDPSAPYRTVNCDRLFAEIAAIQLRLSELGGRLDVVPPGDATPATGPVRLALHRPAAPPPGAHRDIEAEYVRLAGSLEAVLQALAERDCGTAPTALPGGAAAARDSAARDAAAPDPAIPTTGTAARAPGADSLPESPTEVGSMRVPGRLVEPKLVVGTRTVALPPGQWVIATRRTVTIRYRLAPTMPAPSGTTVDAWQVVALRLEGPVVTGAVALTAPKSTAGSLPALWDVAPCLGGSLVHREETSPDPGRPECVSLRRVPLGDETLARSVYAEAIRIAGGLGLAVDGPFWEARSARYAIQGFVDIGRLAREASVPTPESAVQWARALRSASEALAGRSGGIAALPAP
jgi:hypothetical protein